MYSAKIYFVHMIPWKRSKHKALQKKFIQPIFALVSLSLSEEPVISKTKAGSSAKAIKYAKD